MHITFHNKNKAVNPKNQGEMGHVVRKPVFGGPDKVRAVQQLKMARGLKFRKEIDCTIYDAKTKALIHCAVIAQLAVTAQLICEYPLYS